VIYRRKPNGDQQSTVLVTGNYTIQSLSLDWVAELLYFLDTGGSRDQIGFVHLRNQTWTKILLNNLNNPTSIVVHPAKGYVSSFLRPFLQITFCSFDPLFIFCFVSFLSKRKTIFSFLFYAEAGPPAKIWRCNSYAFVCCRVIRKFSLARPIGLTVDFSMEKLFFGDTLLGYIAHMDYDGSNFKKLTVMPRPYPWSLTVLDGMKSFYSNFTKLTNEF